MKNKALIDLDWLESEIEKLNRDYFESFKDDRVVQPKVVFQAGIEAFKFIRSKCEPVKESNEGRLLEMLKEVIKGHEDDTRAWLLIMDIKQLINEIEQ